MCCFVCSYSFAVKERDTIIEVFNTQLELEVTVIEEMFGGSSGSRVFRVEASGRQYVAKFVTPSDGRTFENDVCSARIISECSIGPKLYYIDEVNKLLIMEYLTPEPTPISLRRSDIYYEKLAGVLRRIHSIEPLYKLEEGGVFTDINVLFEKLKFKRVNPELMKQLSLVRQSILSTEEQTKFLSKRPCHCTLHPGNLIYHDGGFLAIDAAIALADPCYDIATILLFWCFSERTEQVFLTTYFPRKLSISEIEKIQLVKKAVMFKYVVGLLLGCSNSKELSLPKVRYSSLVEFFLKNEESVECDEKRLQLAAILMKLLGFMVEEERESEVKTESLKMAQQSGVIGPKYIPGWVLQDVFGDGNCFFYAVAHQLQLIQHPFISEIPEGTDANHVLRLRAQDTKFKDREWAGDKEIFAIAENLNLIVAVVHTADMTQTFTYYFINQSGDGEVTNDLNTVKASVLKNKALIKIAYTGNHYLSVMTTPSDIIEHNFQLLRPNFVLWQRFYETYIEENRHHDPFIQNEYDIRFGLSLYCPS